MLTSEPSRVVGRTRISDPPVSGRWLVIVRPVWMSYRLISEKIVRQWSVWLIFMQIILRACQKPFGTPSSL